MLVVCLVVEVASVGLSESVLGRGEEIIEDDVEVENEVLLKSIRVEGRLELDVN